MGIGQRILQGRTRDMKKIDGFKNWLNKDSVSGRLFTLPFLIGLIMFLVVPMLMSAYYAMCKYNVLTEPTFIGFKNFVDIFHDETFFKSMKVTITYAILAVPLKLVFALFVAMLLFKSSKLTGFYRTAYYLPSIIGGSVAVAVLWKRLWSTDGVINAILHAIGVNVTVSWLGDVRTALWTLIILTVWQFGSSMLIFLAALKQIPTSLYEAAEMDGASKVSRFFKITFPLLTPTIFFNLVMQMIQGFLAFTQCYIITQGKPLNSTLFYSVYVYQQSFQFHNTGYAAALAWVMLAFIGLFTGLLFLTKKLWVYDGGL